MKVQLNWGPGPLAASVVDKKDGTYVVKYVLEVRQRVASKTLLLFQPDCMSPKHVPCHSQYPLAVQVSGEYMVAVLANGYPVAGSPFHIVALVEGSPEAKEYMETGVRVSS